MKINRIYFRVDASYLIGSGHVARCLALASALKRRGGKVKFFSGSCGGSMNDEIMKKGFDLHDLGPVIDFSESRVTGCEDLLRTIQQEDAKRFISAIDEEKPDWIIIDHYTLGECWEKIVRPYAKRIMVIDDLANRRHDCDLLLDQNYIHNVERYDDLLPSFTTKLLGPKYALLREEFSRFKRIKFKGLSPIKKVFIFFGGSDCFNLTLMTLRVFKMSGLNHLDLDVVVGSSNKFYNQVKEFVDESENIKLHVQINNISELMSEADVAIGAGGSTTWERMVVGLPSIVITTAANQEAFTKELSQDGYINWIGNAEGMNEEGLYNLLVDIIQHPTKLYEQSRKGVTLIDGNGAKFCASSLMKYNDYSITVLAGQKTWMQPFIGEFILSCKISGNNVRLVHEPFEVTKGDFCFILSCSQIVPDEVLRLNKHNLVVHASDLPNGKGWSPMSWNILEGKNEITVTLFEAEEKVDSGMVYIQDKISFKGDELLDELQSELGKHVIDQCNQFIKQYPSIIQKGWGQHGEESFFAKRSPSDSCLDPNKTIGEQFNLLRIVDNNRYPAFFDWEGSRYSLKIEKLK